MPDTHAVTNQVPPLEEHNPASSPVLIEALIREGGQWGLDEVTTVGAISGAVGTYWATSPEYEERVLRRLDLEREPASTQVVARDRHAELLEAIALAGAGMERFALELRHLARTEVGEVSEPFAAGQKGSSAMPHKRNPIKSEQVVGLARVLRGNAHAALEDVAQPLVLFGVDLPASQPLVQDPPHVVRRLPAAV